MIMNSNLNIRNGSRKHGGGDNNDLYLFPKADGKYKLDFYISDISICIPLKWSVTASARKYVTAQPNLRLVVFSFCYGSLPTM